MSCHLCAAGISDELSMPVIQQDVIDSGEKAEVCYVVYL